MKDAISLTNKEYNLLIEEYNKWKKTTDNQREGQALMNILWKINWDVWSCIRGSKEYDPFLDDNKIQAFFYRISP